MTTRDNAPPPADWTPVSKPWDQSRCCPTDCPGICETPQHAAFIHGTDDHIIRGTE